jgi:hypothetical protein
MDAQQILLGGISVVTGWLIFVAKLLWAKSEECELERKALREDVEQLKGAKGMADGMLKSYERCPSTTCPFRDNKIP